MENESFLIPPTWLEVAADLLAEAFDLARTVRFRPGSPQLAALRAAEDRYQKAKDATRRATAQRLGITPAAGK